MPAQLLLTPVTVNALQGYLKRDRPIAWHTIRLRKHTPEKFSIPYGYILTYRTGYYKPDFLCRHMTLSGPGRWPPMKETRDLMKLIGFKSTLEGCLSWASGPEERKVVHLVEPVDGNWAPLRSS